MITTTRLRRHESDLLPPDTGELVAIVMEYFENGTLSKQHITGFDKPSHQEFKFSKLFNFSTPEAIEIINEHKKKVDEVFLPYFQWLLIGIYFALTTWGVVANSVLCFIVVRQCTRKTMTNNGPSPRNLYIVNLAVADLLLCIICMPFTLFSLLKRKWTLGIVLCKMVPIVQGTNIMVSSGTITAIAFDRYFTIVRSPRDAMCRCSVTTTLVLIWLTSFLCVLPLVFFQQIEAVKLGDLVLYEVCLEKWPSTEMQRMYTLTLAIAQFVIPLVVLTAVHLKISIYLNVHLNGPSRNSFCKRGTYYLHRKLFVFVSNLIKFPLILLADLFWQLLPYVCSFIKKKIHVSTIPTPVLLF